MMECPSCGSNDVTRVAVTWQNGTTMAVSGAQRAKVRRVRNLQQNISAFEMSPPARPYARVGLMLLMMLGSLVAAVYITNAMMNMRANDTLHGLAALAGLFALLLALVGPIIWRVRDQKKRVGIHTRAMAYWNTLWHCARCGKIAEEPSFKNATASAARLSGRGASTALT